MLQIKCPGCGVGMKASEEKAGKNVKCPKCQTKFTLEPIAKRFDKEDFEPKKRVVFVAEPPKAASTPTVESAAAPTATQPIAPPPVPPALPAMSFQNAPAVNHGSDESTIYVAVPSIWKAHPVGIVFWGFLSLSLALGAIISGSFGTLLWLILPGLIVARWVLDALGTQLEVTNLRTTVRQGILSKHTSEVRHRDVRNIQVKQGILDRVLGVGSIAISSAGQGDVEILMHGMDNPDKIAAIVRQYQG